MFNSFFLPVIFIFSLTYSWFLFYGVNYFHKFKFFNEKGKVKSKPTVDIPVYMWEIFNNGINSTEIDVIKGVHPDYLSISFESRSFINHRLREIRFSIPHSQENEILIKAEVRITTHEIRNPTHFQIYLKSDKWIFLDEKKISDNSSKWISLEVLPKQKTFESSFITILILALFRSFNKYIYHDFFHPILFLSYHTKSDVHLGGTRQKRNAQLEEYEERTNQIWIPESSSLPKKLKNNCRRKPLYIKFSDIDYDSWIVAPSGYEAFQCTGKCTFPVSEHLSPTKHAILQTLLHQVFPSKVARPCCVPTKLDPISILYIDANGVLTYRLRYRDMVVTECGCR